MLSELCPRNAMNLLARIEGFTLGPLFSAAHGPGRQTTRRRDKGSRLPGSNESVVMKLFQLIGLALVLRLY